MSLRDDFEKDGGDFRKLPNGGYLSFATGEAWKAYQSATERALRIGLDVHAWASARNLNWNTVLTEYERRLKGGDNGN